MASVSPLQLGQSVIPLVNKLQDIFAQLGSASTLDLPQVVVVGSQSSGKSSVLEALVGRDFLPRGPDICTRRPLVLQLVHLTRQPDDKSESLEWGEFLHIPGRRFTGFSAIQKEIQAETDRELGSNKGISEKQIRLKIFSPNVLNITLVDLPGITKVPVGDQPSDIEARVRTMILSYIKHETCVILAVSPANTDPANCDALQIARIADPNGSRTIGVITKLDIMDRGTDARIFLLGNVIPLRLGYVGVVNRSQEDIISNKSIRDALADEESFFRSKPVYHSLADRCGIPHLAKKLNSILVHHIRSILPDLKARVNSQIVTLQKELASYGELPESKEIDPCDDMSDEDIRTAIQNATGPRNIIFVPEVPFEVLVRWQIARLLDPSLQCARFIYDELVKISHRCETFEVQRFSVLRRRIEEVMDIFLRDGLTPAETMICHLIEMEIDYINTSHPAFIGGSKAAELAIQQQQNSKVPASSNFKEQADWKDSSTDKSFVLPEKLPNGRAILARTSSSGIAADNGIKTVNISSEKLSSLGNWGSISSIFCGTDQRTTVKDQSMAKSYNELEPGLEPAFASILLKEPPAILRASDLQSEQEPLEIFVIKLLIKSYYDIVRKNVQDAVPKAIMHFLVNHVKRELHGIFIRKLYREPLFEELLQEREDIAAKRKRCKEVLTVLQQAAWTLEELPLEYEVHVRHVNMGDATGLPPAAATRASGISSVPVKGDYTGVGSQSPTAAYMSSRTGKSRRAFVSGEATILIEQQLRC